MSLSDPKYFLFLPFVFVLFYVLKPGRPRAVLLLGASYVFYFNLSHAYGLVLLLVTVTAFLGGKALTSLPAKHRQGPFFALLCVVVLTPLLIFKYLGFLAGAAAGLTLPALVLPVGLSFFTFAALGYLIDVYLEVIEPEWRPLEFALFLAFFPLVTAGPIERGSRFLPQLDLQVSFSSERALSALRLIFIGLFLKVVCADNLAPAIDAMYKDPQSFIPLEKLFILIHYSFYIYADFGGYSLIAIGSAKLFGIDVMANFKQPFLSPTIPEFWRNWHISLSSWVRDYLFTPLRMRWRHYRAAGMVGALLISFVVLGVWHGAGWGFVLFGLFHGLLAVASTYTLSLRNSFWARVGVPATIVHIARIIITFLLVTLIFVVYRADTVDEAMMIYRELFSGVFVENVFYATRLALFYQQEPTAFHLVALAWSDWTIVALIIAGDVLVRSGVTLEKLPRVIQFALYNVGMALIVYGWIANSAAQPFLYYKF